MTSEDDGALLEHVRKRLYVTTKCPALSMDKDGYVRLGLSSDMTEQDMLMLGLYLSLQNETWKDALLQRVRSKYVGATTPTSRIVRTAELMGLK